MFAEPIQLFLKQKMLSENLTRHELSNQIGISIPLVSELLNAHKPHPSFSTVIKIANNFNCSMEEVLGNKDNKFIVNSSITEEQAIGNLKGYIRNHTSNIQELARNIGVGINTIKSFLDDNHSKKLLSISVIKKLSDHWQVPIDEMIGRTAPTKNKNLSIEQTQNPTLDSNLAKEDLEQVKNIKSNLKSKISIPASDNSQSKPAKAKSFAEKIKQERTNKNHKLQR